MLLEGKLAHEWVREAEKAWSSLQHGRNGKHIVIDLCSVSFVDRAGEQFLEKANAAGAILIGADPMMRSLIEEIKFRVSEATSMRKPASLVTILFLTLVLVTLVVGCSLVY